ncbi:MAG: response regulator transcription factor [Betaproteobacteria bacterium]|nr:response regulator transcription factor [Betaproteobacteria bacterium]
MPKHRILLVDDHEIVRTGLRELLQLEPDLEIAGEAATSAEAMTLLRDAKCDLVLLDVSLPDRSGVDTLKLIRVAYPSLAVLVLSAYPEEQYAINLLRAGANGYIKKDAPGEEIIGAIRAVLHRGRYISAAVSEMLVNQLDPNTDRPVHQDLSEREFQVFCKIASGRTVSQIADDLFISVKTVSTYRSRILEKLKMNNNAELTHYAVKNGLV